MVTRKTEKRIGDICADARRVIGLTPIEPRMLELQKRCYGAKSEEEAMMMEVKSYLKCEMKVRPSEIEKLDIVRIFHPAKDDWDVLYVELGSEHQVDSLFSYTKGMKKDNRVVRWIPKQMFARFKAIGHYEYNLRNEEHVKTRVKIGKFDFELSTREPSSSVWKRRSLPYNLPDIEISLLSRSTLCASPPPGRPGRAEMLAKALTAVNDNIAAQNAAANALADMRIDAVTEKRSNHKNISSQNSINSGKNI